jgi:hypothetical protein
VRRQAICSSRQFVNSGTTRGTIAGGDVDSHNSLTGLPAFWIASYRFFTSLFNSNIDGSVRLTIPAGTQGGKTFRLRGKGMPDLRQKETHGDILATISIEVPETLTDEERELYQQLAGLADK